MFVIYFEDEGLTHYLGNRIRDDWQTELKRARIWSSKAEAGAAAKNENDQGDWANPAKVKKLTKKELFDLIRTLQNGAEDDFNRFDKLRRSLHELSTKAMET